MNKLDILGIGTTGVVAAGSGGLYMHYKNNETTPKKENTTVLTSSRLTAEGFEPLKLVASDKDLKAVLAKYKVAKQNTFDDKASWANEETLITECAKALSEDSKNDLNYKLANQWCVKESTIETIFNASGWKTLDTRDETADTQGHWAKKVQKHKTSQAQNKIPETLTGDNNNNIKEIKDGCKALNIETIKTTDEGFNTKFEQAKEWCAIKE